MLINLAQAIRQHELKIRGVIHVGAHHGQEMKDYEAGGIKDVVFVEPCKETFLKLKENVGDKATCFNVACGETSGQMVLHKEKANGGMSNSLLQPAIHLDHYPDIQFIDTEVVDVRPLDSLPIDFSRYNFLMMDVQGFEKFVLLGAKEAIKGIDYVMTEVNIQELYRGCTMLSELEEILSDFVIVEKKMVKQGWGDALFVKRNLLPL